jgi:hypothetical protein
MRRLATLALVTCGATAAVAVGALGRPRGRGPDRPLRGRPGEKGVWHWADNRVVSCHKPEAS